jgi:hypothetical protein
MKKTFLRLTFAIMTTIYILTHFLPHARAERIAPGEPAPIAVTLDHRR